MTHKAASAAPSTSRAVKAAASTALADAREPCSPEAEETDLFVVESAAAQLAPPHPTTSAVADVAPPPFDLEDEEPPFDAPDEDDEIFQTRRVLELEAEDALPGEQTDPSAESSAPATAPHAPAIGIHVSWERPAAAAMLTAFASDPRLGRTEITESDGGLDAALAHFAKEESPDLLIVDTALGPATLMEKLDRLLLRLDTKTRVIVIGEANDVGLLRDLARRGIAHYLLAPKPEDVVAHICDLYAERDNARVIAVVGSRGGAGASTLAQNIGWSIAERQQARTALVDLDLSFGVAGFEHEEKGAQSMGVGFLAPDIVDDGFLSRAAVKQGERLSVFAAPPDVKRPFDLEADAVLRVIGRVRRTAQYVVVDVPHHWAPWVKAVLASADEVLVAATPDLASLRNAKNIVEALKECRQGRSEALVMLSMVGNAKGSEISPKDFTEAIGAKPVDSLAFDPALFGMAAIKGKTIGEMAPRSPAAATIDSLAWVLTGREAVVRTRAKRLLQRIEAPAGEVVVALQETAREMPSPVVKEEAATLPSPSLPKRERRATTTYHRSYASAQFPLAARSRKSGGIRAAMTVVLVAAACVSSLQNHEMLRLLGEAAGVLH